MTKDIALCDDGCNVSHKHIDTLRFVLSFGSLKFLNLKSVGSMFLMGLVPDRCDLVVPQLESVDFLSSKFDFGTPKLMDIGVYTDGQTTIAGEEMSRICHGPLESVPMLLLEYKHFEVITSLLRRRLSS